MTYFIPFFFMFALHSPLAARRHALCFFRKMSTTSLAPLRLCDRAVPFRPSRDALPSRGRAPSTTKREGIQLRVSTAPRMRLPKRPFAVTSTKNKRRIYSTIDIDIPHVSFRPTSWLAFTLPSLPPLCSLPLLPAGFANIRPGRVRVRPGQVARLRFVLLPPRARRLHNTSAGRGAQVQALPRHRQRRRQAPGAGVLEPILRKLVLPHDADSRRRRGS